MNRTHSILSFAVLAILTAPALAQINGAERGSDEAFRRIDAHNRRLAMENETKGPYYDDLKAFWQANKSDPAADASAEYERLAKDFALHLITRKRQAAEEAEEKLFAYRRGRVRRNQEKPIEETEARVYFNHGDAKEKAVKQQEAIVEQVQAQLEKLEATKQIPHLPVSWAMVDQGTVFYVGGGGTVFQVLNDNSALIEKRLPSGGKPMFWVTGIETAGLSDGGAAKLEGVFLVDGTETYDTLAGTNTVKVLRRLPVEAGGFYALPE